MYDSAHTRIPMTEDAATFNLPTASDIRRWKEQLDRIKAEEAEMKARHAAEERALRVKRGSLHRLINAAAAFLDQHMLAEVTAEAEVDLALPGAAKPNAEPRTSRKAKRKVHKRGKTWTATILKVVKAAGRGITYAELKEEVSKTHLGDILSRTDKAFYGGIGKLSDTGLIVKYNGRLYTPTAYKQFRADVEAGLVADIPAPPISGTESPNEIAVERFLKDKPDGVTAQEIVTHLLTSPPSDLAVTTNKNSIYNLLARHRERGKLIRRGERYYLPSPETETPDSEESGVSAQHGGGNGDPSSFSNEGTSPPLAAFPGAIPAQPGE